MSDESSYIDKIAFAIAAKCGMSMFQPNDCRLLRIYAVLALAKGVDVTKEDVHDAWCAWVLDYKPQHKSLKRYGELTKDIQDLDEPYRQAIEEVAQNMEEARIRWATQKKLAEEGTITDKEFVRQVMGVPVPFSEACINYQPWACAQDAEGKDVDPSSCYVCGCTKREHRK